MPGPRVEGRRLLTAGLRAAYLRPLHLGLAVRRSGLHIRPHPPPLHLVIRKNRVVLPKDDLSRRAGLVHVNDALVARTAEPQADIILVLHKFAVHQHIYIL